ncbi:MAG: RNA polymerase factor sigma-54 [Deltaproteobacteria bacterium]|nr:RNA polymerase factor sigma-54 [Deltaproteobacteria bacterium]
MGLEVKLQLKISQQLKMTPQLQQAIKLLQLSRMELVGLVRQEMEENPVLEETNDPIEAKKEAERLEAERPTDMAMEGIDSERKQRNEAERVSEQTGEVSGENNEQASREIDWDAYLEHHTLAPPMPSYRPNNDELPSIEATYTRKPSLIDHLMWQLRMQDLDEEEERIGALIIGNLGPHGYLREPPLEDIARLAESPMIVVEDILQMVQTFDPVGVGARDLVECLMIQAKHVGQDDEIITRILRDHLGNLERKNYQAICKDLGEPLDEIVEAVKVIASFDPKPGRLYSEEEPVYITPDVYVHKIGDKYFVVPNDDGLPKLKISNFYRAALKGSTKERQYVQEKLRSAQWLIRSIQQRQRTIIRVTESIVQFQREFFEKGISFLRPLILRDVAEDIGMHESTISRVTTAKYVHTPQGIFELKFFFNSGINRMSGDDIASESVKKHIKDIIATENGKKPFSDQKIVELLRDKNIDIARRTVAKYREQMGILSSSKRKKFF